MRGSKAKLGEFSWHWNEVLNVDVALEYHSRRPFDTFLGRRLAALIG